MGACFARGCVTYEIVNINNGVVGPPLMSDARVYAKIREGPNAGNDAPWRGAERMLRDAFCDQQCNEKLDAFLGQRAQSIELIANDTLVFVSFVVAATNIFTLFIWFFSHQKRFPNIITITK